MSGMPIEARFENDPAGGVTDAEREDLGGRLNSAYEAGALELYDYKRLLEQLYAAQHNSELVPVARALPATLRADVPVLGGDAIREPGQLPPINTLPEAVGQAGAVARRYKPLLVLTGAAVVAAIALLLIFLL